MKKLYLLITGCMATLIMGNACASEIKIDIFKTKQFTLADIQPIVDASKEKIVAAHDDIVHGNYEKSERIISAIRKEINETVLKKGKYAYLQADFVHYPKDPNDYLTVNVVDQSDASSMPVYNPKPTGHYQDPAHLIKDWQRYLNMAMPLYMSGKLDSNALLCKEFHCIGPFSTPALKKYENEFNKEVPKHQLELAKILKYDASSNNRATAAFLLGHTTNENQLISWLIPALNDSDEGVRNNVTRILALMSFRDKHIELPLDVFMKMLHSPVLTDRNKALGVLCGLSRQPRYAVVIKREAGNDIMENLKLYQPDLHDNAYLILKQISKQHYSDRDYPAWSHWLGLS